MSGTRSVCVVDDDPIIRMIVSDVLDRLGYESLEADNGKDALELILQHHPEAGCFIPNPPQGNGHNAQDRKHNFEPSRPI